MFSVASTAFYTAWNNLYTCGNNLYIFLLHSFDWKMEFRKCWQPASISESKSKGKASPYLPDGDQRLGRKERSQCIWWWTNQFHCNLRHFWLTNNLYMCVCVCVCVCVCITHSQINGESGGKWMHDMVTLHIEWAPLVAQMLKNLLQCRRPRLDPWVGKIPWRRGWLPTPVFLPRELHEQRSLAHSMGSQSQTWLRD